MCVLLSGGVIFNSQFIRGLFLSLIRRAERKVNYIRYKQAPPPLLLPLETEFINFVTFHLLLLLLLSDTFGFLTPHTLSVCHRSKCTYSRYRSKGTYSLNRLTCMFAKSIFLICTSFWLCSLFSNMVVI